MRKRFLWLIMLGLIMVLGGTAFAQNGTDKQAVILPKDAGYLEREIGRNSGVKIAGTVKLNSQNQLVVCDLGSQTPRYVILNTAGKPVGEIKAGFTGNGNVFAMDAHDNLYVLAQNPLTDEKKKTVAIERMLYVYATAGANKGKLIKQAALGKVTGDKAALINDLVMDTRGNLYCLTRSGIGVFDQNGQSKRDLAVDAQIVGFLDGDGQDSLIIAGMTLGPGPGSFLEKFDPLTGQVIWKQNITVSGGIYCGRYNRADRCTYLVDGDGVLKFDPQGRQLGSILDLKQQSILGFESVITGINLAKGSQYPLIYLTNLNQQVRNLYNAGRPVVANGKPYNIYQYSYVPKLPKERNQKVITISTLMPDRFLETAISAFQSTHPGIKVELKSFVSGNRITKVDMEQFTKSVSTELMAGKGSDIISLGFSPFQKLVDRNVLVDLGGLMAKDKSFDRKKYYANILDACKYKGGLYALPVYIQFDVLEANPAILDKAGIQIDDNKWNWDDFLKVAEKVSLDSNGDGRPDQFALPNMDRSRLFNWVFQNQYSTFVDLEKKKAYFDRPEFIELLNYCKTFSDKQLMNPQADPNASQFKIIINGQLMDKGAISTVAFTPTTVLSYSSVLGAKTTFQTARLLGLPGNGTGGGFETPLGMLLGMNRKSKLQKEAWEFLKFLLADEAQTSQAALGFAVNKDAQGRRAAAELAREKAQEISNPLNASDMEQVEKIIANLHRLNSIDPQLIAIIDDELVPFFNGQKSAAEVAKLIQSKVSTYLLE